MVEVCTVSNLSVRVDDAASLLGRQVVEDGAVLLLVRHIVAGASSAKWSELAGEGSKAARRACFSAAGWGDAARPVKRCRSKSEDERHPRAETTNAEIDLAKCGTGRRALTKNPAVISEGRVVSLTVKATPTRHRHSMSVTRLCYHSISGILPRASGMPHRCRWDMDSMGVGSARIIRRSSVSRGCFFVDVLICRRGYMPPQCGHSIYHRRNHRRQKKSFLFSGRQKPTGTPLFWVLRVASWGNREDLAPIGVQT